MADDVDIANDMIAKEVSLALRSQLPQMPEPGSIGAKFCEECGDAIPVARQKMGFKFCVPCAQETERKRSLFA